MSIAVAVESGLSGTADAFDGEILDTLLPRAFAPGAPVSFTILEGVALRGKALFSKKTDDGSFRVRLRLLNLRREDREALSRALPSRALPG